MLFLKIPKLIIIIREWVSIEELLFKGEYQDHSLYYRITEYWCTPNMLEVSKNIIAFLNHRRYWPLNRQWNLARWLMLINQSHHEEGHLKNHPWFLPARAYASHFYENLDHNFAHFIKWENPPLQIFMLKFLHKEKHFIYFLCSKQHEILNFVPKYSETKSYCSKFCVEYINQWQSASH
jgi:hypothetical protein